MDGIQGGSLKCGGAVTGRSLRAGEEAAFCLAQESLVLSGVKGGGWKLTASSGCTLIGERGDGE